VDIFAFGRSTSNPGPSSSQPRPSSSQPEPSSSQPGPSSSPGPSGVATSPPPLSWRESLSDESEGSSTYSGKGKGKKLGRKRKGREQGSESSCSDTGLYPNVMRGLLVKAE
jgi:hypothetical protein